MGIPTLDDLAVEGRTVGVRVDINSPLEDGRLADDARIRAHLGTLSELADRGGQVVVLAHQGRPGGREFAGLEPHAERLDELLSAPVGYSDATFSADARERVRALDPGELLVLENTRFYSEEYMELPPEEGASTFLVRRLAPVLDAFVNDAFAASHRSQASLVGFPAHLPSYAGRVMEQELDVLGDITSTPRPRVYALGGAKVSDAIDVARVVLDRGLADAILTSGMVGNAFLVADGVDLGAASVDPIRDRDATAIEASADLLETYRDRIHTPRDLAVEEDGERRERPISAFPSDTPALDIGAETAEAYERVLGDAGTVILNGPAGVYEDERFAAGSRALFRAATRVPRSIVGGGDTAAALRRLGVEGFDHVSTGGGATLRMLTGDPLPGVEALRDD